MTRFRSGFVRAPGTRIGRRYARGPEEAGNQAAVTREHFQAYSGEGSEQPCGTKRDSIDSILGTGT